MLGPVPPKIAGAMAPMPADFDAPLMALPGLLKWRGNVVVERPGQRETIACEAGSRFDPDLVGPEVARQRMLQLVWHIRELARLGYIEGLKVARLDRHAGRPVSVPQLVPSPSTPASGEPG